jgi:hypothetical protein
MLPFPRPGSSEDRRGTGFRAFCPTVGRVDLDSATPLGEAILIADRVAREFGTFATIALLASQTGIVAYRTSAEDSHELVWLDRDGRQTRTLGTVGSLTGGPQISPDGCTVAVEREVEGNRDICLIDTTGSS